VIILGVDTSLSLLSVALLRDEQIVGAIALEGKGSRNEKLLPAIDWLLRESKIEREMVDLFAVTRGPGSFTGVRIGLATIQGLALVLGKPVCAISTHEAIALGTGEAAVVIVDDAGRGEFYVTEFRGGRESVAPRLSSTMPEGAIVISDFLQRGNVAAACARRAARIAREGELDRYSDVTPIYVRLAEAEVKLQQKQNA
jgi:tRNA threonylcarbamoyladenosine biosynthesis protein TsaB